MPAVFVPQAELSRVWRCPTLGFEEHIENAIYVDLPQNVAGGYMFCQRVGLWSNSGKKIERTAVHRALFFSPANPSKSTSGSS